VCVPLNANKQLPFQKRAEPLQHMLQILQQQQNWRVTQPKISEIVSSLTC